MAEFQQNVALRIFTDKTARGDQRLLYREIIERARVAELAVATVITDVLGFGRSRALHTDKSLRLSYDRPLSIEIVGTRDKIEAFLPAAADHSSCLIMLATVEAARPKGSGA